MTEDYRESRIFEVVSVQREFARFELVAGKVINKKAYYVFSLKGNQSFLDNGVRLYFETEVIGGEKTTCDKGYGRIER
ncbi:hypothetical protein FACS1894105_01510 [Clostridia bacterium]|nr:hypothetical protein FACS1894105_01480 [Clostridia bacterium]GHU34543.1 hypothetical protein FACS1894105_01510 [Clostridia bacterium]